MPLSPSVTPPIPAAAVFKNDLRLIFFLSSIGLSSLPG
jgi:hypothetical protein